MSDLIAQSLLEITHYPRHREDLGFKIYNPQSETGNPPEGWESEGQIINVRWYPRRDSNTRQPD